MQVNVNMAYHVGGKFEGSGSNFHYVGDEIINIPDMNPDMITEFGLEVALKGQISHVENVKFYYKKPLEEGVDGYQMILNDFHIKELCATYSGKDVYDIYVERECGPVNESNSEYGESDSEYGENEFSSESEDSNDEVGSWISEEDREEVEEIGRKAREAKENL
ncbi:hypothetical protein LINPERPRIM_LOCUS24736 [Linum perenne]